MPSGSKTKSKANKPPAPPSGSSSQSLSDEAVLEFVSDRYKRLSTFYAILSKYDNRIIKFKFNKAQQHFEENRTNRNIILKSRQHGFTTYEAIDILDSLLFTPNYNALIISYDKESMEEIFDNKVMFAWNLFPLKSYYEINTERSNKLKVGFKDNPDQTTSKSFSSVMVRQSGRGGTFDRIHISEFGRICKNSPSKAKEIVTGAFPTVPIRTGRIDIESTAEEDEGEFYEMFWKSWRRQLQGIPKKLTEFQAFFYNWQWDVKEINSLTPDPNIPQEFIVYQTNHNAKALLNPTILQPITDLQLTYWYYKWLELGSDWRKLFQEYPTTPEEAFVSKDSKFFDISTITPLESHIRTPIIQNNWNFFREYVPGHRYVMGVDVAEGVGKDSSAIIILDVSTPLPFVVATYTSDEIDPAALALEIRTGALLYGLPIVGIERNNHGHTTIAALLTLIPEECIFKMHKGEITEEGPEEDSKYGWQSNRATKPKMLYDLRSIVTDQAIVIPSAALLAEMKSYPKKDIVRTLRKEDDTKHWDMVIALGIALQMRLFLAEYGGSGPVKVTNSRTTTTHSIFDGV